MTKLKNTKKIPTMKLVGIIFLAVTLLVSVSLTNNTVRKFITDSFAFDPECAAKGNPGERNRCQLGKDDDRRSAALKANDTKYNNVMDAWKNGIN